MGLKKEGNEDDDKEMRGTRTQCNGNDEGKSGNSSWIFEVGPALDQITGTLKISGYYPRLKSRTAEKKEA